MEMIKTGICGSVINTMGQEKKKTEPRPAKFVTPSYSLILKGEKTPVSETYLNDEYAIRKVNGNTFLHKVMPPRIRNNQFDEIDSTMRKIAFLPLGSQETPKKMFIGARTPTMVPTLDPKSQLDD
ncbi:predicted protein [Arabidopsis lyrata subsp. lyrata]|uniref:Predicted protein n=1 Tax=Arabidopsis lyrata subsp. lyrata TaxID=81972 RepID=D7L3D5_ARALL|nr:predicted protein [Arabidopsis lyrata subsp. lyrata]